MRSYPELSEHELRTRLCGLAAEHEPDRAAMLHRVGQHRAGPPVAERRPAGQAVRLAGSALAVATILGVGGMARWALADGPEAGVTPVPATSAPAAAPPTAAPSNAAPPNPVKDKARRDAVWADGSINPNSDDTEGRSDITLKLRQPVRALELTVRVAPTSGLTDQGSTHDVTDAPIGTTVVRDGDTLVYLFELAGGATLRPGTYVFTARYGYDNEGGRDAGADSYSVTAATVADGAELKLRGDFF